jgi:hypothetical protein
VVAGEADANSVAGNLAKYVKGLANTHPFSAAVPHICSFFSGAIYPLWFF